MYGDGVLTPEIYTSGVGWRELTGATSEYAYGDDQKRWWYPRSWVAPDGSVFGLSGDHMYSLDPSGDGSITPLGTFPGDNIGATSTAVMFRPGKIHPGGWRSIPYRRLEPHRLDRSDRGRHQWDESRS